MLNYCFVDKNGFIKLPQFSKDSYFSIHIFVNNLKVEEIKYQRSNAFLLDLNKHIASKSDVIKIRYFTKTGDDRVAETENIGRLNDHIVFKNLTLDTSGSLSPDELKFFIAFLFESNLIYDFLCKSNTGILKNNKKEILFGLERLCEVDKNFLSGVFYYRISDLEKSKLFFSKTKDSRNSYDNVGQAVFLYDHQVEKPHFPNTIQFSNSTNNTNLTALISCDVGYLFAYKENLISSLNHHDQLIHVHVLVNEKSSIDKVKLEFEKYSDRINLSFELLTTQDKRVYSSISRYIVASRIMAKYGQPVLVVDIDVDFSFDCINSVIKLNLDDMGFFITQDQMPWKKILAGFCYFPNNEKSYTFLDRLSRYLIDMCEHENYYWTIDQVALTNMYDSEILDKSSFFNLKENKKIRLKQVEERQAARRRALEFSNW